MAKLTFYGATESVTGSAYLLETNNTSILLECGLIQGSREDEKANESKFPFSIEHLDAVILSHAHLDHSGRLPKLFKDGFRQSIYMTHPTYELLEIMLKDAAFLELRDTEWENKRRRREGKKGISPLFTPEDAQSALQLCKGIHYGQRYPLSDDIDICFPVWSGPTQSINHQSMSKKQDGGCTAASMGIYFVEERRSDGMQEFGLHLHQPSQSRRVSASSIGALSLPLIIYITFLNL